MKRENALLQAAAPISLALIALLISAGWNPLRAADLSNSLSVHNALFWSPERGHYVETAIHIHGAGLRYEEVSARRYRSRVELTVLLRAGDEVLNFDKYVLESPLTSDTTDIEIALTDLRRLTVGQMPCTIEVLTMDMLDSSNRSSYSQTLETGYGEGVQFSDICFIEGYRSRREPNRFTKHGIEMMPWVPDYLPDGRDKLAFYAELYGSPKAVPGGIALLTASVRNKGGETINPNFWIYRKSDTAKVVPFLAEFDITQLPTGNYELVVELRDRDNAVVSEQRRFFQRVNRTAVAEIENVAMMDISQAFSKKYRGFELDAYLSFISVVAETSEQQVISSLRENSDTVLQQQFLYNFWLKRDEIDPYAAWLEYLSTVKLVNREYGSVSRQGYRTDRGRVMLQYGRPTDIIQRPSEPGAKPYEVWIYNAVKTAQGTQGNVKFIFYDPSLVTNDYVLAHSNAVGELQDPRWQYKIYGSTAPAQDINNLDNDQIRDHFGGNATDIIDR